MIIAIRLDPGPLVCKLCQTTAYVHARHESERDLPVTLEDWTPCGEIVEGDRWEFDAKLTPDGKSLEMRMYCPNHRRLLYCVQWEKWNPATKAWTPQTDYTHARLAADATAEILKSEPLRMRRHVGTAPTVGAFTSDEGKTYQA